MSEHNIEQEGAHSALPPPSPGKSRLTKGEISALMKGVAEGLAPYVKRIAELETRLAALEQRPEPKYLGVWSSEKSYPPSSFVTDQGSVWFNDKRTTERPGTSDAWVLAVKRGRDGRDAR